MKYIKLKEELKELAKEIREWKNNRKLDKRSQLGMNQWQVQVQIDWRKDDFRHKHIAYCMLRGRKYEQIENYCRVLPSFSRIDSIMEQYESKAVCASA
jgi:hypothetical protein